MVHYEVLEAFLRIQMQAGLLTVSKPSLNELLTTHFKRFLLYKCQILSFFDSVCLSELKFDESVILLFTI